MSKQANPTVIGGFVLGAVALVIAGILIFGSGKFFTSTLPAVMYFESDVQGLRVGAPVNFRGVQIGSVSDIRAELDAKELKFRVPVIVELVPGNIVTTPAKARLPRDALAGLVDRGMRAQLQTESLVTGQLFVQLDIFPEEPPAQATIDPATQLLNIPTIPTTLQEASQAIRKALDTLAELPLDEMVKNLGQMLENINALVSSPEAKEAARNLNATLVAVQQLAQRADSQMATVGSSVTKATDNLNKLARNADAQVTALAASLKDTSVAARDALEKTQETLTSVEDMTGQNSPMRYELVQTLRELTKAARALRLLADYLERHPSAVVFGRGEEEE